MSRSPVSRRALVAGGFVAGGTLLLGASTRRTGHHVTQAAPTAAPAGTTAPPRRAASTPAPSVTATSRSRTAARLSARLRAFERSRNVTVSVALIDHQHHSTFSFRSDRRTETLSILKVLILVTALRRSQERGARLSRQQAAQASAMITRSDNRAAGAMLTEVGAAEVRRVARLCGLTSTVIQDGTEDGRPDWWGYSTTNARDQLRLLSGLVRRDSVISATDCAYLTGLMSRVTPSQRWGVCAPPLPPTVRWNTKNGWGGREDGFRANSIGHISGNGRDYDAVILARSPRNAVYARERAYGFETASGVSQILYDALAHPLS